jgi:hypothetical protein
MSYKRNRLLHRGAADFFSFLLLSGKNGLKGQKDLSPGQRPGKKGKLQDAPHRGKRVRFQSFAPVGRYLGVEYNTQGVALG